MLINNVVIILLQNSSPGIAEALTIRKPSVRARVVWLSEMHGHLHSTWLKSITNNNNNKQTLQGRTINERYVTKAPVATTKSRA